MPIIGIPAWQAELVRGGMARVSVTYPNPSAPAKAVTQSIFFPAADVAELAGVLAAFVAWKSTAGR